MKNIKQDFDELRPEYRRSDFGEMVRGKYAGTQVDFAEVIRMLLICIGEDEGLKFSPYSPGNHLADHKQGDWTYEMDNANQITLRYWLSATGNIEEPISNSPCVTTAQDRTDLQNLLVNHVRNLKGKVAVTDAR